MQLIRDDLRTRVSFLNWIHILNKFIESSIKTIKRVEEVQNYKLAKLLGSKLQHDTKKVIHNYSSYELSKTEISLLLKSLNVSLPPKKFEFEDHLLPFELLHRDLLPNESDISVSLIHLKNKIKDADLSFFRLYNKKDHRNENLSEQEYEAFINLQSNKNIIMQRAHKGNSVVAIDRLSYVN